MNDVTGPALEDFQHIRDKIFDYLSRQDFSEKKLLLKVTDLKRRYPKTKRYFFYTKANVQKVIDELKKEGFINDKKYAQNTLRQLKDRKDGLGRIREKMYRRLIPPKIINEVLGEFKESGQGQDFSRIIAEVRYKRRNLKIKERGRKATWVIRSKIYVFLVQKGYSSDEIKEIMKKAGAG